ncbi:MAG: hypothetical protein K9J74_07515 [Sulfuritalea sp.]|nr:hypothetical protein [Sulfuritalea sp.]
MNTAPIFVRTSKGEQEAEATSSGLARDLHKLLRVIDGVSTVAELRNWFGDLSEAAFDEALDTLISEDLIQESEGPVPEGNHSDSPADESQRQAQALRAKLMARRKKAESSTEDVETPGLGADEQMQRDAEEQAQNEKEALAREEAEKQARREAEEQARLDAEAEARRKAEELARQAAEAQAQREAEERARLAAAEQARRDTEEQVRREAEERVRREEEALDRLAAEESARLEAEKQARQHEKEAKARKRAKEDASVASKNAVAGWLRTWGKVFALGLTVLILVVLGAIHLISFDGQIPQFEKALSGQFQQPVKIKSLHLSLIPRPHLRFDEVTVGGEGQIRILRVNAMGHLGGLFSEKKDFKSIELDSPSVTEDGLRWILFGKPVAKEVGLGQVSVMNAQLELKHVSVPAFAAQLKLDETGAWSSIAMESNDRNIKLILAPKDESVQFDFDARSFKIPFGSKLTLEDWTAKGTADRNGLSLSEFKGFVVGGFLSGQARLDWRANWNLTGELRAKQIDAELLAPGVLSNARLAGAASLSMQAPESAKLFASPRLEGNFVSERGTLLGVDIARMLQGRGIRGDTRFVDLTAGFVHEQGATHLRQLHLSEGAMSASGTVDIDAEMNVSGRLLVDLKLESDRRRATLAISGTSRNVTWDRR